MDPTPGGDQNNQAQEKQSGRETNLGIDAINRMARGRFKNPLGKIGSRVMVQAGRSLFTFILTTPAGWVILGITILVIIVFLIVFMGASGGVPGAPPPEPNSQMFNPDTATPVTTAPTIAPTETIAPAPEP